MRLPTWELWKNVRAGFGNRRVIHMRSLRLTAVLLLASTLVFAKHPKIAEDLDAADPSSNVDVIVQFRQTPTEAHHQKVRVGGGLHKKSLDLVVGPLFRAGQQAERSCR